MTRSAAAAFALGLLLGVGAVRAAPSVPWTPSPAARHYLELLVDGAGLDLPVSQWPLPRAAVQRAVQALPATLPPALGDARDQVLRELRAGRGSQLSATVRGSTEMLSGFGDDSTPGSSVRVRSSELNGDRFALQVGGRIDLRGDLANQGPRFRADDSAIATEAWGIQLQAWSHRAWWGPGWESSLVLGNNAPAFNGVGFQRASASRSESPWLSWLGPWSFDFFVAQLDDTTRPANPYLVGQRITVRPFSQLELGFTRTAQWGGRGREQSAKSFLKMLLGQGVNADTASQQAVDPANELAGFDARLRCFGEARCAVYAQLIGEDMAGWWPSHYLGLYGVETWSADGRQRWFAEYAETGCRTPIGRSALRGCAYRNSAYPEGYTSAGRWIGASTGPDSRLLTLGWLDAAGGTTLRLNVGRVGSRVGQYSPIDDDPSYSGHVFGLSARQRLDWGSATITPEFDWQRLSTATGVRTTARVGASLSMSLDSAFEAGSSPLGRGLSGADGSVLRPLLIAGGLVAGSALFDHTMDDYAKNHGANPSARAVRHIGSALPIAGIGLAGLSWLAQRGTTQGDVAYAAVAAGVSALGAAEVLKFGIGRDRPIAGQGADSFGNGRRGDASFPSAHSSVAWAVVTPYAKYYDAPWLYGLAALTNAGRVMSRDHWLSDTVAGAALGYYLGDYFYRGSGAANDPTQPRLWISPNAVIFQMRFF